MGTRDSIESEQQQAVLRRGRAMAALPGPDRRDSYYGRTVGLVLPEDGGIDDRTALATVLGKAAFGAVPLNGVHAITCEVSKREWSPDI